MNTSNKVKEINNATNDCAGSMSSESAQRSQSDTSTTSATPGSLFYKKTSKFLTISRRETTYVILLKVLVFAVMIVEAVFVAQATFRYTESNLEEGFEDEFAHIAEKIGKDARTSIQQVFGALRTQSIAITSIEKASDETWPFVTVPHFETRGQDIIRETKGKDFVLYPLVTEDDREKWEVYSAQNQGWVQNSLEQVGVYHTKPMNITPCIHSGLAVRSATLSAPSCSPVDLSATYFPIWQQAPVLATKSSNINFDAMSKSVFQDVLRFWATKHQAAVTRVLESPESEEGPKSAMIQPILSDTLEASSLVAVLSVTIPWKIIFEAYADGSDGAVFLVLHSCTQSYTFLKNGAEVTYLGEGTHHDTQYESTEATATLIPPSLDNTTFSCPYEISIYPTESFHDTIDSNSPFLYTVGVVFIFFLLAFCFIVYDCCVEHRQERNVTLAAKSNAVVTSLFPAQVTDRLLGGQDVSTEWGDMLPANDLIVDPTKRKDDKPTKAMHRHSSLFSKPIADIFPACTVMFADMVGFTSWSSKREPSEVFRLLEIIYNAFDVIARRRQVFKVETIGDCYIAVVGLPEPRKNHATVMARFANDCLVKMCDIVKKLDTTMGNDTAKLTMRIGLHTGSVVAGVLRGDKSRFQLFGDTVNVASQMENTSIRGRIHISTETAEELIAHGKEKWIRLRQDKIAVKGKGLMKTFWLEMNSLSENDDVDDNPSSYFTDSDSDNANVMDRDLDLLPQGGRQQEQEITTISS